MNVVPMWPPCPPTTHPPGCQCGCGGNPSWGNDLFQCWEQMSQLKCIVQQIMNECGGPIKTGPIQGVVDGSPAAPGQVGEFISGTAAFSYGAGVPPAGNPWLGTVSPLVVPPGDWDIGLVGASPYNVGGGVEVQPLPTGLADKLQATIATGVGTVDLAYTIWAGPVRGLFSVPTLIPVLVSVYSVAATPADTVNVTVFARRMR